MASGKPKKKKGVKKTYQVWIEQVNACTFQVDAVDAEEAREKAHRVWRNEYASCQVSTIEPAEKW